VGPQVGTISEAYPHLILDNLTSPLGVRVATILKHLFPVPKPDSRRVVTWANRGGSDFISFRHHTYAKASAGRSPGAGGVGGTGAGPASIELTEVRCVVWALVGGQSWEGRA
jgi:rRNA maturation protein Rpf1